jgi:hypothetical protein
MGDAMQPDGMDAGVAKDDFQPAEKARSGGWVAFGHDQHMGDEVVAKGLPQAFQPTHAGNPPFVAP